MGNSLAKERMLEKAEQVMSRATKLFRNALLLLTFESTNLTHCFSLKSSKSMKVDFSMLYFTFKGPPGENEHKTAARNSTGKTMFLLLEKS